LKLKEQKRPANPRSGMFLLRSDSPSLAGQLLAGIIATIVFVVEVLAVRQDGRVRLFGCNILGAVVTVSSSAITDSIPT
jgi:glycerol uptake facilitator-like aquaporin